MDEVAQLLSLDQIDVFKGFNHRRHFDQAALENLAESIRAQGVIQNVVVRPKNDRFELLAGERRLRASKMAGRTDIPAIVRDLNDEQALAMSLSENVQREGISVADEATAARQAIDLADGDYDEAARILGWTLSKLKTRQRLLCATDEVLDAVSARTIKIGIAELLCSLDAEQQNKALRNIVAQNLTVDAVRSFLDGFAHKLSAAAFDTQGCNGCQHNTDSVADLFDTNIGHGRCTKPVCWDQKTQAHIAAVVEQTKAEVATVALDRDKDPATYVVLTLDAVGEQQYTTGCAACAKFGALVATAPGKEGSVTESVCFGKPCYTKMAAAHAPKPKVEKGAKPAKATPDKAAAQDKPNKTTASAKTGVAIPKVKAWAVSAISRQAHAEVNAHSAMFAKALVALSLKLASQHAELFRDLLNRELKNAVDTDQRGAMMEALLKATFQEVKDSDSALASVERASRAVLAINAPDLTGRAVADEALFRAQPKAALAAMLKQMGFEDAYNTKQADDKAFAKLMKGKTDEIVKVLCGADFAWDSVLPPPVSEVMSK